jgi:hypothetical protein
MMPAVTMPAAGPVSAGVASGRSAFVGSPTTLLPLHHRHPYRSRGQRQAAQAILEKVRDTLLPSNGSVELKSDSCRADVLQKLGVFWSAVAYPDP